MEKLKETNKKVKASVPLKTGLISAIIIVGLVVAFTFPKPILVQDEDDLEWRVIWEGNSASAAEADPGSAASGWLATWCYDYAETPSDDNATNGNYDTWTTNVSGYQHVDDAEAMDLASEDPFYFVVRCRFNDTNVGDAGTLMSNRCKVALTVSGDETISDVTIYGHDTNLAAGGGAFVCANNSNWLYINFYWDDNSDGYKITDDGTLAWNITISAQF